MKSQWLNFVICSMFTLLLSYGCNNDDFDEFPHNGLENTGSKIQKNVISGQNFLSKYNLQKNSPIFKSIKIKGFDYPPVSKSTSNQNTIAIDSDKVIEFITDTVKTYTFPVLEGTLDYPQNLILQTFDDTNFKAFLVTYDPSEEWLKNTDTFYQGKKFIEEFSGQVHQNKSSVEICHLAVEAIWRCNQGRNHEPGFPGCFTENPEFLGYEWVRTCSNGPGGGFGNPNWTNPGDTWNPYEPEDPINGGGSSSNAGGTTTDTYNLPTDPVDLEELERQVQLRMVRDCLAIVLTPQDNIWLEEQSTAFLTELNNLPNMGCSGLAITPPYQTLWQAVDEIILDPSFENNDCLIGVYNTLGGSEKWNEYLKKFEPDNSVAHLTFAAADNLPEGVGAWTHEPNGFRIKIEYNLNMLNNPNLIVALFFIHEMIHAEIFRKLLSLAKQGSIQWSEQFINSIRNDFPGLSDYYARYKYGENSNESEHELMAQHYRPIIKQVLKEYIENETSDEYFDVTDNDLEKLSWIGLMGSGGNYDLNTGLYPNSTKAWIHSLSNSERTEIIEFYEDFRNEYLGDDCE